jgi:ribosomal protein S16
MVIHWNFFFYIYMLKLIKSKKTKQNCNNYNLRTLRKGKLIKIGNYEQQNNILRLNLNKFLIALNEGNKPSFKTFKIIKKTTHFNNTKKIKLKFSK